MAKDVIQNIITGIAGAGTAASTRVAGHITSDQTYEFVRVSRLGGLPPLDLPENDRARIQIDNYGNTEPEAWDLHEETRDFLIPLGALPSSGFTGTMGLMQVGGIQLVGGPNLTYDPDATVGGGNSTIPTANGVPKVTAFYRVWYDR